MSSPGSPNAFRHVASASRTRLGSVYKLLRPQAPGREHLTQPCRRRAERGGGRRLPHQPGRVLDSRLQVRQHRRSLRRPCPEPRLPYGGSDQPTPARCVPVVGRAEKPWRQTVRGWRRSPGHASRAARSRPHGGGPRRTQCRAVPARSGPSSLARREPVPSPPATPASLHAARTALAGPRSRSRSCAAIHVPTSDAIACTRAPKLVRAIPCGGCEASTMMHRSGTRIRDSRSCRGTATMSKPPSRRFSRSFSPLPPAPKVDQVSARAGSGAVALSRAPSH